MKDPTENIRRALVAEINRAPGSREALEAKHGQIWDTDEMTQDFWVTGFMAPLVSAIRKSDGANGSLRFQHRPRFYFNFSPDGDTQ
jgi:hypothetical protein